jgi:acetylornithine/N-succinyldiaminopimelate aminotransferase
VKSTVSDSLVMQTYRRWPVEFVSGSGATLVDSDGKRYIDLLAGIAVASVGHCHPRIVAAVTEQLERLIHVSNLFETRPQQELADRLGTLSGGKQSFFCNSGAEAIEAALKLARRWARDQRDVVSPHIVCAQGSFHGRTFGALAATGQPAKQQPFAPMLEGFVHVPYGDPDALESAMDDRVVAVLLEPIQGEAGIIVPPAGYLAKARALCDQWGALLILDEVQAGLGRTGCWFAHTSDGIDADVVCLAKALAGGLPMGACLARPEIAAAFQPGDHATTFGGGPVVAAAALAVLDVIEDEGLLERAIVAGRRLREWLERGMPDVSIRGRGLMLGVQLPNASARDLAAASLSGGVVVNDATPDVIRITPPLVISDDEIDRAATVLSEAWDAIRTA